MSERFVIEGEWSGYTSAQRRVVHRSVHGKAYKRLRAWADKTHAIRFTDGTSLVLSVRDCKPRERVAEIGSYARLIEDCAAHDVCTVHALVAAKRATTGAPL